MLKWLTAVTNRTKQTRIKDYEIEELKYSYRQMGKYVKSLNIPELADIEYRIENELRDIEVKKKWFSERMRYQ